MGIRISVSRLGSLCLVPTLLLAMGGCASTEDDARIPSGGNDCFWAAAVYDWQAINDQSIVVWSPSKRCPYLVEFPMRCVGIRSTDEIGFTDRDGRICPFGGDAVIVPGSGGDRCTIASIRRITPEELADYIGDGAIPDETGDSMTCAPDPEEMTD